MARNPTHLSQSRFRKLCDRVRKLGGYLRDVDVQHIDGKLIRYELVSPGVCAQPVLTKHTTLAEIEAELERWENPHVTAKTA